VNSFVYLCNTPHSGTWIGCSPEILLSGHEREWTTVALAGTQPLLPDGTLPTEWDDKNRREQALVSEYIASQLRSLSVRYEAEGPIGVKAVSLAHLKSIFRFSLPNEITLGKALAHLHPTPAVCGTPKQESYRFILNNEGYDRRYYSGFVGYVDPEGVTDIYVNLRCARVDGHEYHLYAGGGLLKSSVKQHEWIETQRKMRTILSLIEEQEIQ
jgi:isochorismate synthase